MGMIIALGHEAGTGKDTFVMFATDHLRRKFKNLEIQLESFADRLYDLCASLYGWAGFQSRHFYVRNPASKEEVLPKIGKTPRQCLIGVAEKVREFDPHAWLRPVFMNKPKHVKFIADLRTPEEVSVGREMGVYLVRCDRKDRPPVTCSVSAMLRGRDDCWDEILVNNGNLTDWQNTAIEFTERKIVPHIQQLLLAGVK